MMQTSERIPAISARSPLREEVAQAFTTDGDLARADRRFQARQVQTDLADAVAEALESRSVLVAEAGTGVGKIGRAHV